MTGSLDKARSHAPHIPDARQPSAEELDLVRTTAGRCLAASDLPSAWAALRAAGIVGFRVPQELGGSGLTMAHAMPVMEAIGERCVPTAFVESSVAAAGLLAAARTVEGDAVLRSIAAGAVVAVAGLDPRLRGTVRVFRDGGKWLLDGISKLVLGGSDASRVVVVAQLEGQSALFLAEPGSAVECRAYPTIDGRRAADLGFRRTPAVLIANDAHMALDRATDEAVACLSVEAAALMRELVRRTVDYVRQREQFDQPVARFQVVQHRLVDMHMQARRAGAIARRAAAALDLPAGERARLVSAAKVTAGTAGRFVGQQAVQLHGAMGMTEELEVGRFFKRLTVIEGELGGVDDHLRRFVEASGAPTPTG